MKNSVDKFNHILKGTEAKVSDFAQKKAIRKRGRQDEDMIDNFLTFEEQYMLIEEIFNKCYSVKIDGKKELLLDIGNGAVQYLERAYKNFSSIIYISFKDRVRNKQGYESINLPLLFEFIKSKPPYSSFTISHSIFFEKDRFVVDNINNALIQELKMSYDFKISDIEKQEYIDIVKGLSEHWRGYIPTILDHMIAGKYVSDKKSIWLLIMAKSNFGKSKIFKWVEGFGGASFIKFSDLTTKGINNKSPKEFMNKTCLVIDEVMGFSRSLFEIENELDIRPMRNHSVKVPVNSRYLLSADGGTFNNEYQDQQIINRVAVIDLRGEDTMDLGKTLIAQKYGQYKIQLVMTHYLYTEMKKRLDMYESKSHIERVNYADETIKTIFNNLKMKKKDFYQMVERSLYEILENPKGTLSNIACDKLRDALHTVNTQKLDGWLIKRPQTILPLILADYDKDLEYELEYKKISQIASQITGLRLGNIRIDGKKQRGLYVPNKNISTEKEVFRGRIKNHSIEDIPSDF